MNVALILSGGLGARFGSEMPKQYQTICGKQVIAYSIEAFRASENVHELVIACGDEWISQLAGSYDVSCVPGGSTRNASLKNGLDYIQTHYPDCEKIMINEAARPFITADIVDTYLGFLGDYDAVITAQHITDSLGRKGEPVTDRSEYYLVQAPEAFRFPLLYKHFSADTPITATVQQLPAERYVMEYYDFTNNLKITYKEDLIIAEAMMALLRDKPT
jgi:2-C-methyl-D-erythritol 4-phosphate cytidylyltransferase